MTENNIVLPSKPKIVLEKGSLGVYEIDGLYPGYGHTLGNSLRRIILSSLTGAAVTHVKIAGVSHEFSTISGVKEDVITILLNLKKLRVRLLTSEPQTLNLKVKGIKDITAKDIELPGQVELLSPEQHIASVTEKSAELDIEITVSNGLGYVTKEVLQKERVDIGTIALDAAFTPIKKVNYEVENMRIGDRTDFNRLRITVETDGTMTPHEALEQSIAIMINQLKAIVGFKEEEPEPVIEDTKISSPAKKELDTEFLKTRIETLNLSQRTTNALTSSGVRTVGGLVRKKEEDIENVEGLGPKGIQEIRKALAEFGVTLK
ncbi:MAG: DNA-directed RNA polymerase subunit alpha [Candidatus Taylorbacteria bacterium CG10_big_fil_rev_8_21_14_0_10_41_48]|uniref:DNA-directed RNA polymerase subunit alpha n=1 Tax=Candidatus Taylorbacteria bacterium CG10_big_fil_rev_8_21_14_0_10_41_48 TaxID=1975024 RepID=A0A2M8LCG1_9BACT|nr:MAG: DNA-directed RNA polymerase subunit alpha [Candidatus Taylorbacteria bacterium CG10_big_fil_rev_8_21_14_0_10_41_48]